MTFLCSLRQFAYAERVYYQLSNQKPCLLVCGQNAGELPKILVWHFHGELFSIIIPISICASLKKCYVWYTYRHIFPKSNPGLGCLESAACWRTDKVWLSSVFFNAISVINPVLTFNYWKTRSSLGTKASIALLFEAQFSNVSKTPYFTLSFFDSYHLQPQSVLCNMTNICGIQFILYILALF